MFGVSDSVRSQPVLPVSAFSTVIGLADASEGSARTSPTVHARRREDRLKALLTLALLLLALPLDLLEALLALLGGRGGRLTHGLRRGRDRGRAGDGH